ncbi:transketolase C-terminal domain-containing protein [Streptomyces sp. KL116D]|uniref:transketolase C-terminal domain-containing protein n=1 Tax=Streptomyces sp. KL116D TaxID=3045152 RepID=UPI0035574232
MPRPASSRPRSTLSGFAAARACEQIKVDVAGNDLPVRIIATHGGPSAGHYGPTHHAVDDIGSCDCCPTSPCWCPPTRWRRRRALIAAADHPGPVFLRLPQRDALVHRGPVDFRIGRALTLADGDDVTLIATGPHPVLMARHAAETLAAEGIRARVLNMHTIKPLDEGAVLRAAAETGGIVTVEDHLVTGGAAARSARSWRPAAAARCAGSGARPLQRPGRRRARPASARGRHPGAHRRRGPAADRSGGLMDSPPARHRASALPVRAARQHERGHRLGGPGSARTPPAG